IAACPLGQPPRLAKRHQDVPARFERVAARRPERLAQAGWPFGLPTHGLERLPDAARRLELRLSFLEVERGLGSSVGGILEESAPRSLDHRSKGSRAASRAASP